MSLETYTTIGRIKAWMRVTGFNWRDLSKCGVDMEAFNNLIDESHDGTIRDEAFVRHVCNAIEMIDGYLYCGTAPHTWSWRQKKFLHACEAYETFYSRARWWKHTPNYIRKFVNARIMHWRDCLIIKDTGGAMRDMPPESCSKVAEEFSEWHNQQKRFGGKQP